MIAFMFLSCRPLCSHLKCGLKFRELRGLLLVCFWALWHHSGYLTWWQGSRMPRFFFRLSGSSLHRQGFWGMWGHFTHDPVSAQVAEGGKDVLYGEEISQMKPEAYSSFQVRVCATKQVFVSCLTVAAWEHPLSHAGKLSCVKYPLV